MTQSINEQIGIVAPIESEAHFFKVGLHVLRAQLVPATAQAALKQRECGFNRVCVCVAANIFLDAMLNHRVFQSHALCDIRIGREFVSENDVCILADVFSHELFERTTRHVLRMEESEFAITLTDAEHWPLFGAASTNSFSVSFAANIGFVNFNLAVQHWLVALGHCRADSVAEIPCCPVASESQGALNLAGRHPFLCFAEQQGSNEPLGEGQVRVIEDRARSDRELIIARLAVVECLFGFEFDNFHLAAWAPDAFGPAQASEEFAALFIGREHRIYIN